MDLLQKLLKADMNVKKEVFIKRLDSNITVSSFTNDDYEHIQERCTFYEGKGNKRTKQVDTQKARHMLIAKCLVEPNLNSKEALESTGSMEAYEVVKKVFLPGEQELIENAIGEISGFVDGEVDADDVKN